MAKLTGWLTIDRLNGGGNAIVTLDASAFTELGERNASLKIKTSSRDVIVNINQKHYEEPLIPDNIPNNQIWVKSTDGTVMSFYSAIKFEYDLIETLEVTPTYIEFEKEGGTAILNITCNTDWIIELNE